MPRRVERGHPAIARPDIRGRELLHRRTQRIAEGDAVQHGADAAAKGIWHVSPQLTSSQWGHRISLSATSPVGRGARTELSGRPPREGEHRPLSLHQGSGLPGCEGQIRLAQHSPRVLVQPRAAGGFPLRDIGSHWSMPASPEMNL